MKYLLVLFMLTGAAFAQCPVEILHVNPHAYVSQRGSGFKIEFRNASEKKIKGVEFNASYFDGVNTERPGYESFVAKKNLEPTKKTSQTWVPYFRYINRDNGENGAEAWVTKVLFEDGSIWRDDGSRTCKGESNIRAKNK